MADWSTPDLCDAHEGRVAVAEPLFRDFGGRRRFRGPAVTLRVRDDNTLVRAALETPGQGRVLVVDGGGSTRCALLGDRLGDLAVANGWAGVVVFGCVRDTEALGALDIGVKALASHPQRSRKGGGGERDVPVTFAGVTIAPGAWVYADPDGVVIAPEQVDAPA
jgi:regulator of ribonuclease activity A